MSGNSDIRKSGKYFFLLFFTFFTKKVLISFKKFKEKSKKSTKKYFPLFLMEVVDVAHAWPEQTDLHG